MWMSVFGDTVLILFWLTFILFIGSRENNHAERIFKIMPERNAHSYCTMIRGMVKVKSFFSAGGFFQLFSVRSHIIRDCLFGFVLQHEAYSKAYNMYIDLLNERHKGELYFVVSWAQKALLGSGVFVHGSDDWRRGTDLSWIMGAECKLVIPVQLACGWLSGNRFAWDFARNWAMLE